MLLTPLLILLLTAGIVNSQLWIGTFTTRSHAVQGDLYALSDRIVEIRNFRFDGNGPAYFWADTKSWPSTTGYTLLDASPTSSCGAAPLPWAGGTETWTVEFPKNSSLNDILGGSISVWNGKDYSPNYGEVVIPWSLQNLDDWGDGSTFECIATDAPIAPTGAPSVFIPATNAPVPDPTGAPTLAATEPPITIPTAGANALPEIVTTPQGFNCEPLHEDLHVRWQLTSDSINIELIGNIDDNAYMSFGISGSDTQTNMIGADTVVCDSFQGQFRAIDFYMNARTKCTIGSGVCPDQPNGLTDDVSSVSGDRDEDNDITIVRYSRPLTPTNLNANIGGRTVDRAISVQPGDATFVVWAIGPIEDGSGLPLFHSIAFPNDNVSINFGRSVQDNCQPLVGSDGVNEEDEEPRITPFFRPVLKDAVEFTARIGPPGGANGYSAITGQEPFAVSWYINDLLVPTIEMRRGTTYRFLVSGGSPHPLYLTSSSEGGLAQSFPDQDETIFAGVDILDGDSFEVTAAGPLCAYKTTDQTDDALQGSYSDFFASLDTSCATDLSTSANAAVLEFIPDENTPDLIYYQCATHRNMGWEIKVVDAEVESIADVDCSNFAANTLQLANGLTLNSIVNPIDKTIRAELIYEGEAWIAMGFTAGQAVMVGSEAVLGLPGQPSGAANNNPAKYDLNSKSVPGVQPMEAARQTLVDHSIEQNNTHTVLRFTKQLVEDGEHPLSEIEENTFLWAIGSSNNLGIHARRGGRTFLPAQCAVFIDGVLQNPDFVQGFDGGAENDNKTLWTIHGLCAATAWAILVPLAIGSSLIRRFLEEKVGLSKGVWFQIHRALNMIAAILTLVAFAIAFYLISQLPGAKHFSEVTHHFIGLVIFVLTMLQAIGGVMRPHVPHQPDAEEESSNDFSVDEESADLRKANGDQAEKSTQRIVWEYGHRILGVVLLVMAWWQVQNGLGLFAQRFDATSMQGVFFGVVGTISGAVAGMLVYQACALNNRY